MNENFSSVHIRVKIDFLLPKERNGYTQGGITNLSVQIM